jgi:hypothetical protein
LIGKVKLHKDWQHVSEKVDHHLLFEEILGVCLELVVNQVPHNFLFVDISFGLEVGLV